MGNPALLRGRHRIGHLDADPQDPFEREAAARDQLAERLAVDALHREKRAARILLDGIDRDNVWMIEGGDGTRLALDAFAGRRIGSKHRWQDLQRDRPMKLRILGRVDLSHPAAPERVGDDVVADCLARCGEFTACVGSTRALAHRSPATSSTSCGGTSSSSAVHLSCPDWAFNPHRVGARGANRRHDARGEGEGGRAEARLTSNALRRDII
ncbi:MAG TPA: hypothetical protein VH138_09990 [Vicinamibacterales bacterium]|nr:hypothetical protein [Vicinamibacterales bacterium]